MFDGLFLDRKHFANVYKELLKHENCEFVSMLSVYSAIMKEKKLRLNFNNFVVPFYVFKELNIVKLNNSNAAFIYSINKEIKTDLNKSRIYNTLNLIKRTLGN